MAERTSFDKSLDRLKFIFTILGLVLERDKYDRRQTIKKRCIYILNLICLDTELLGSLFFVVDGVKSGKDVTELTSVIPCFVFSLVANFKSISLVYYEQHVHDLIEELRELDKNTKNYDIQVKNKVEKRELKFLNFIINILNINNVSLMITFSFLPLIFIALKYIKTGELELVLPFQILYPFDPLDLKYWPYVYLKQLWSECISLLNNTCAEYFYYTSCTYIQIQFRFLSYEFENLIPNKDANIPINENNLKERLKILINWHQRLIRATNTLELIYTKPTLFNFVSSSMILCLVGFNARNMEDKMFAICFITFLCFSLLQIYFLCSFGDMIMMTSLEVSDAVYNSLWYLTDRKVAKILQTVIIRAQTPCKLTASGFGDVNLNSFSKILSTSWSYFALLNTMYGENKE